MCVLPIGAFDASLADSAAPPATDPQTVASSLLSWLDTHGRAFPWRAGAEPFEVLVAEILLRQTRAESVPPVLTALMRRCPHPEALALACEEDLKAIIAVLGFGNQRAAQLRALGVAIMADHGGVVPGAVEALRALPGVGAYTAGLVAATCFGSTTPAVDTNVARVLCRFYGLTPSHAEARKSTNVWDAAAALSSARPDAAARLTWAAVDLAASVCTARSPDCPSCPLAAWCAFSRVGNASPPERQRREPRARRRMPECAISSDCGR